MTLVVYKGHSGKRNALRHQLGYVIGGHRLPVGEPVDLPDDVAEDLLNNGRRGHKFAAGAEAQEASEDAAPDATPAQDQPDTGGSPTEGGADADTAPPADEPLRATPTTTRRRGG